MVRYLFLWSFLLLTGSLTAQSGYRQSLGAGLQAYPTGLIPEVTYGLHLTEFDAIHLRFGYQFIDHRELGVHSDESGTGYGGTLGYRRHFQGSHKGFFTGIRCDLWRNTIDWIDYSDFGINLTGASKIWVLQPTLEAGYLLPIGMSRWAFRPSLAFGYEINVITEGEPTGQGAILLLGIAFDYRW